MNAGVATGLLQLISAAVTPVVLISACAALILGINNKHTAIADRLRLFAADLRGNAVSADRRIQIRKEVAIFFRRYRLTWMSLVSLYGSVIAFVLMIVFITMSQKRILRWEVGILALFFIGIGLTMAAVVFEMFEIRLSIQSLEIELGDVTAQTE